METLQQWKCKGCKAKNKLKRTDCRKCGTERRLDLVPNARSALSLPASLNANSEKREEEGEDGGPRKGKPTAKRAETNANFRGRWSSTFSKMCVCVCGDGRWNGTR